jgi:predicted RecA/RadA family phage recombinase
MVDRYAKFGTEHLAVAASRTELGNRGNVLHIGTFLAHQKKKTAQDNT